MGINRLIRRVLLCTSPLQVINARAAMDHSSKPKGAKRGYSDDILIIHPILLRRSRELIYEIGEELGFNGIFDISEHVNRIMTAYYSVSFKENKLESIKAVFRFIFSWKRSDAAVRFNTTVNESVDKIWETIADGNMEREDYYTEIYSRKINTVEKIVLSLVLNRKKIRRIEDGIGDYEYRTTLYHLIKSFKLFIWNYLNSRFKKNIGYKKEYSRPFYSCNFKTDVQFLNLNYKNAINIKKEFLTNIMKLGNKHGGFSGELETTKNKVFIIGTLLADAAAMKITLEKEIALYNYLIKKIKSMYAVTEDEIWYKPHPRITHETWERKKEELDCRIFDINSNPIFEIYLASNNVLAVFSFGSTSLLYAGAIFGIPAFLIHMKDQRFHPRAFKMYYDVCTQFGLNTLEITV